MALSTEKATAGSNSKFEISPSILSADFARLGEEVDAVCAAGADSIHMDVMDNHYVPNLTVGPMVCHALKKRGVSVPIHVHLMTVPVDNLIEPFAKAGAHSISFHPEATQHVDRTLQLIKGYGMEAGLALNPATPFSVLEWVLDVLDSICVMTVNPGFGGQKMVPGSYDKLRALQHIVAERPIRIAVDGGVTLENLAQLAQNGATTFIAGSAIFGAKDYGAVIGEMRKILRETSPRTA